MIGRPGRPSKAALERTLKHGKSEIVAELKSHPLRQPVDPVFDSYYQRVLNGDPRAIIEYCDDYGDWRAEPSFYEIVGRLVPLQPNGAVKHIIAEIVRRGVLLAAHPEEPPYQFWYGKLKRAGNIARAFIREAYEEDVFVKREQLWNPYVNQCYVCRREDKKGAARSEEINVWRKFADRAALGERNPRSLKDQIDEYTVHYLVPRQIFLELADSCISAWDPAGRDKRCHNRRFLWTPSHIARKYACAMVGISPSTVSHKNRRK
jgi:hypothetical protein